MLPNKSGQIKTNRSFEDLLKILFNNFKNGKPLELKSENELKAGKFTIKKRNQIFNPFDRKLIMGEIKGQIIDSQIDYKIEMSNLMKFIFLFDVIILFILSIGFFSNGEHETGLVILGVVILAIIIIYFWLKSELKYLENRFQEKIKSVCNNA